SREFWPSGIPVSRGRFFACAQNDENSFVSPPLSGFPGLWNSGIPIFRTNPMSSTSYKGRLFLMMVLELAIWGAWLPLIFSYLPSLGFSPGQQAAILNTFPIAAIIGLFFSNQFADRNFAAERFLAFSHLIGGVAILLCGFVHSFWAFFLLMFVHCLL